MPAEASAIVDRIDSPALLSALDSNMAAFWSPYGRGAGCTLHASPAADWLYTGVPHPLFNGVVRAQLAPDEVAATLGALRAHIETRGAPALWWVGPQSRPADLGALLEAAGLQSAGEVPGMALELASLPEQTDVPSGLRVEKVDGARMQEQWARILCTGMGFTDAATEAVARIEATLADPQYSAQHRYIGVLDGTPVAAAALVQEAGVAGIYAIATLPAARKRGIGSYMTILPLIQARRLGYKVGILQASSMGHPVYRRMGFSDVCTYRLYSQR